MTDFIPEEVSSTPLTIKVAGVRFTKIGKLYHFDCSQFAELESSDYVIVETMRGRQMGQIMGFIEPIEGEKYIRILRPATSRDLALRQEWELRQNEALDVCKKRAKQTPGVQDAKLVAVQYNYDGTVMTILYTAEERVDTARFSRELGKLFNTRIEMRQIGPRDVAKLLGGYGACGSERCCSTFLTDFSPISIKMAKVQGISLSPSEITGMCGRLRCCLVYEYDQYVEARKQLPRRGKKVGTPFGDGKVIDLLPMKDMALVFIESVGVKEVAREDIVPLEELRALAQKAKEPCSKHGDGACDCGKPKGQRRADQVSSKADEDLE